MATATMATAVGAALLYYTLSRRLQFSQIQNVIGDDENSQSSEPHAAAVSPASSSVNRIPRRPSQAPATWLEAISTLSETLRFTYSETLGKWPIGDLAFGINYLLKRQGNVPVASIYAGKDSVQLRGLEIITELRYLLNLLTLCWHFSKKPFPLFLDATGYSQEDALLQEPKAGLLKPAFTILVDKRQKCFLLLIRGTHSIRDTLTAATGAVVPFHHTVLHEGGVSNLVLGYAHCGMVVAARWIAKLATPCLLKALREFPDYNIKIVGHSLGGGTAALLTYILREQQEFASATCFSFAPAACMTWELAESGEPFITSVINGADLVPTFSCASVDDLRSEVTASAWLNDLRNQIEHTKILSTLYRSASALGSHLPSIASARARVAGAGAILRPVSNGTQVVMRRARNVAQAAWTHPPLQLSSWSCMGPRRRNVANSNVKNKSESLTTESSSVCFQSTQTETTELIMPDELAETSSKETITCAADEEVNENGSDEDVRVGASGMTEDELWHQLENEICRRPECEEVDMVNEIRKEEDAAVAEVTGGTSEAEHLIPVAMEARRFFPPGKIIHIISLPLETAKEDDVNTVNNDGDVPSEPKFGIFLTTRSLYGKLRLSQAMVNDHYMPVYRKNIEKLINDLEEDNKSGCSNSVPE